MKRAPFFVVDHEGGISVFGIELPPKQQVVWINRLKPRNPNQESLVSISIFPIGVGIPVKVEELVVFTLPLCEATFDLYRRLERKEIKKGDLKETYIKGVYMFP